MKNRNNYIRTILFWVLIVGIAFTSCRKDTVYTGDVQLQFSEELITFDTVFTTIGSVTRMLKVINPHKNTIKTDIRLLAGNASCFSVNVDGESGTVFQDVEIRGKDSIFIFIKVNLTKNLQSMPMVIADTLAFLTNGNRQNMQLLACGEDANFIVPKYIYAGQIPYNIVAETGQTVTWKKDKPYVIYGYAVVDSGATLNIEAGTRIYLHKGAGMWVYMEGCLHVNGTKDEPVVFQGDRRSEAYERDFAQWDRIWICEGKQDNTINYAVIKNATIGIQAEVFEKNMGNKLILTNTEIRCSELYNFLGRGYTVEAYNNIFSNSAKSCVALVQGGNYTFINNTIYNQYSYQRTDPAVLFSNHYSFMNMEGGTTTILRPFSGVFTNNIVYGNLNKELTCGISNDAYFMLQVENCLIKTEQSVVDKFNTNLNNIFNIDPKLDSVKAYNFNLKSDSPCKGRGKITTIPQVQQDITETVRNNPPSIGAYE